MLSDTLHGIPSSRTPPPTRTTSPPQRAFSTLPAAAPLPRIAVMDHSKSILDLPFPGTKGSPKLFKGKYTEIKYFFEYYERMCQRYNLITDKSKCETVVEYCSDPVREVIQGMKSFNSPNWSALKDEVYLHFNGDKMERRFTERDLKKLVRKTKKHRIKTLYAYRKYTRRFTRTGGWLLAKKKITEKDYNTYFWNGLSKSFRPDVERRLLLLKPELDRSVPYPADDVKLAIEFILSRDRFYDNESDEDSPDDDSTDDSDITTSDDESDSSESNDDSSRKKQDKRKKRKSLEKRERSRTKRRDEDETYLSRSKARAATKKMEEEEERARKDDEIDTLVKKLNELELDDRDYGVLFYKLKRLDPSIADVFPAPDIEGARMQRSMMTKTVTTYPNSIPVPVPAAHRPPLNILKRPPPPSYNAPALPGMANACFGCGEEGHQLRSCKKVDALIAEGVIIRENSPRGPRLTMRDGQQIFRQRGETLVDAARKLAGMVRTNMLLARRESVTDDDEYESESEDDAAARVYAAEKRRAPKEAESSRSKRVRIEIPSRPRARKIQELTPYDIAPEVEDAMSEDELARPVDQAPARDTAPKDQRHIAKSRMLPNTAQDALLEQLMKTKIEVAVGDLISFREMESRIKRAMRISRELPDAQTHSTTSETVGPKVVTFHAHAPKSGRLIRLPLDCHGETINAVIDTGSEINVTSSDIYARYIKTPIIKGARIVMYDANGGTGVLDGLALSVPLKCGAAQTVADIYVGDDVAQELLLGRPWQQNNKVSIDEREDGTYLVFKGSEPWLELAVERRSPPPRPNPRIPRNEPWKNPQQNWQAPISVHMVRTARTPAARTLASWALPIGNPVVTRPQSAQIEGIPQVVGPATRRPAYLHQGYDFVEKEEWPTKRTWATLHLTCGGLDVEAIIDPLVPHSLMSEEIWYEVPDHPRIIYHHLIDTEGLKRCEEQVQYISVVIEARVTVACVFLLPSARFDLILGKDWLSLSNAIINIETQKLHFLPEMASLDMHKPYNYELTTRGGARLPQEPRRNKRYDLGRQTSIKSAVPEVVHKDLPVVAHVHSQDW